MSIRKVTDWSSWWDGLRTNLLKCIGTTGTAYLGTNAVQGMGVNGVGISWKQAAAFFGVHIAFEVFSYMQRVQPQVITETVNSDRITQDSSGNITTAASKTVTTTEQKPQ